MNTATDGTPISSSPLTCLKKRRYSSEASAWSVIFKMRAKGCDTERLTPYRCDHCKEWHLGRQPPRVAAAAGLRNSYMPGGPDS